MLRNMIDSRQSTHSVDNTSALSIYVNAWTDPTQDGSITYRGDLCCDASRFGFLSEMKVDSPSRLYGGTFRLTSQAFSYYGAVVVSCVQTWYYFNRYTKVPQTFCFLLQDLFS